MKNNNDLKKIAIITTRHNPDDNRVYHKEVLLLAKNGYHVYYFAPNNIDRNIKNITYISLKKSESIWKRLKQTKYIVKQIKKNSCEIVHIHDVELLPFALKIKKKLKIHVIYDVHEDYRLQMLSKHYLKDFIRKPLSKIITFLENEANKKLDAIIVADNFVYKYFTNKNTIILYNYPKISDFNTQFLIPDISKRNEFDIIFPGSMNVFTAQIMIEITKKCHELNHPIKCIMISPFNFKGGKQLIYDSIKKSGIDEKYFCILDRIPTLEVQRYLSKTKIGMLPLPNNLKLQHNIPTKLFEYMYCFLPVVAANFEPTVQYMRKNNFGFFVNYDDITDYASKIIKLLDDENDANKKGQIGHNLVIDKYNWEKEGQKLIHLYAKVLS